MFVWAFVVRGTAPGHTRIQRCDLRLPRFLVFLEIQGRARRIVEVVRAVLVALPFFEQRVPEPVFDHFRR